MKYNVSVEVEMCADSTKQARFRVEMLLAHSLDQGEIEAFDIGEVTRLTFEE